MKSKRVTDSLLSGLEFREASSLDRMLSSYLWVSLLLSCAVSGAVDHEALKEDSSKAVADDHVTDRAIPARIEVGKREEMIVDSGNVNGSDIDLMNARLEGSVREVNRTEETVKMGHYESNPVKSDSSSHREIGPGSQEKVGPASEREEVHASEVEEDQASSKESAGQASEREANPASQGEAGPTPHGEMGPVSSLKEISNRGEQTRLATQGQAGLVPPVEDESDDGVFGNEKVSNTEQQYASSEIPPRESYGFAFDEDERTGKILAYYTSKTKNLFHTTTVSRLSTCFSATNTDQCTGRRKKRHVDRRIDASTFDLDSSDDLHGTVADPSEPNYETANELRGDRDPKKFTVWSTLFSTFTLTSTYYYPGTTVTVSEAIDADIGPNQRESKLLAIFASTTFTHVTTTTKLALQTCWSTSDQACNGRRKRRSLVTPQATAPREMASELQLDGSIKSAVPADEFHDEEERTGRKLTVWTTGFTRVTITTTSYYEGTTVSVSALCTVVGMGQSCFG
ncbi:hypothetical protein FHG87_004408 [Trinorchestia longiramus]|nr:hypothetical protein FHG87_004408 [Trinorchestia longiramus]